MDKNLQAVVKEAKPFILPILPYLAPRTLVPGKNHVPKDLSFYEVAWVANSKAHQAHLEQREKKNVKTTLEQAPATNHPASNSTFQSPANKKGPVIQLAQRA